MGIRRGWWFRTKLSLIGLAVLTVGVVGLAWTQPALAAFTCPSCFGFEAAGERLFVEAAMPSQDRVALTLAADQGRQRVTAFYGALKENPIILACATPACARRIGSGGSLGGAYATLGLRLSPLGLNPVIIAHERSHIELHGRIGLLHWLQGAVPSWFDEGLAVVVSDDPRYVRPGAGDAERCLVESDGTLPARLGEWLHQASIHPDLYAKAACQVSRWMATHGGRAGVLAMLDRIAAGDDFATAYASAGAR